MAKVTKQDIFTLKIAGEAGQGIKSAGILFARFVNRSGYDVYNYIEYPSIIRGGHNVMQINISPQPVLGPSNKTDLLIALNQETLGMHIPELLEGSAVVYDEEKKMDISQLPKHVKLCPVPLSRFAKEAGGNPLLINVVALGAATAMMNGNLKTLNKLIEDEYGDKSDKILNADLKAAELGYNYAKENHADHVANKLTPVDSMMSMVPKMVVNGNEAVALGAISAGLQFASIYPMSPTSNILHILAKHQEDFDYIYKQPEDEISAINMTIGASFAGARAMTATSGGGFALMSEGYGLAGITETPIVIVEGMRGGPATGIPTWSEQGDLRFVLHAHQSDWPRIVLTPGDGEEIFHMTMEAFNLADRYQTTVVILIDKNLCENDQTFPMFDTSNYKIDRGKYTTEKIENYKRYDIDTKDGVSLRAIPGSGNFWIANSDEHDEEGFSSEEIQNRNDQMNKRMKKLEVCAKNDMPEPNLYGPANADLTLISWGSNKGSILQALKEFDNVNYLHLNWVSPFPVEAVTKVLNNAKHVLNLECNFTGQMKGVIREQTGFDIKDNYLKYDGRPFYVEELIDRINESLKGNK